MQFTLAHQEGKLTAEVERNVKNLRADASEIFALIIQQKIDYMKQGGAGCSIRISERRFF